MPVAFVVIAGVLMAVGVFLAAVVVNEMPSIKKAISKMFQSRAELKKAKIELARRRLEIEHEERMAAWRGIDDEPEPIKGAMPTSLRPKQSGDEEQVKA
tara:strand:- start:110469 stop:110765 length:297 start_codon:yes stop_codon:yes gene_type:complete